MTSIRLRHRLVHKKKRWWLVINRGVSLGLSTGPKTGCDNICIGMLLGLQSRGDIERMLALLSLSR